MVKTGYCSKCQKLFPVSELIDFYVENLDQHFDFCKDCWPSVKSADEEKSAERFVESAEEIK